MNVNDYLRTNIPEAPKEKPEEGRNWVLLGLYASGSRDKPLIKVEGLEPMSPEEFAQWLWHASKETKLPARPLSRDPKPLWRASEQSKEELARMSKWREEWNRIKRKYPSKTKEEIDQLTKEKIDAERKFKEGWNEALEYELAHLLDDLI